MENGLERHQVKTKCRSILSKEFKETTWNNFLGLKEQFTKVSSIVSSSFAKDITNLQNVLTRLPVNIHSFTCRYLMFNLANNSNLFCWKILLSSNFTWKHNSIVTHFVIILIKKFVMISKFLTKFDLTNYENPGNLCKSKRPDIVIKENNSITAIELTCPFDLNIIKSREYKENNIGNLKMT